jgi:hypothetical protein
MSENFSYATILPASDRPGNSTDVGPPADSRPKADTKGAYPLALPFINDGNGGHRAGSMGGDLPLSTRFSYGINRRIVGKADPQKLSYAGAWENAQGNMGDLGQHIGNGHPWMPALLNGNGKRWQSNANHAEVLALDVDGGMTIAEAIAHPFIVSHAGLGIESSSSTTDLHKFRLVFRNSEAISHDGQGNCILIGPSLRGRLGAHRDPEAIAGRGGETHSHRLPVGGEGVQGGAECHERIFGDDSHQASPGRGANDSSVSVALPSGRVVDVPTTPAEKEQAERLRGKKAWQVIKLCNRYLMEQVGAADPACKDSSRFFFGGLGREAFLLNEEARLPEKFIDDAIAWGEAEERKYQERAKAQAAAWANYREQHGANDLVERAAEALGHIPGYIPGQNTYSRYVAMAAGILREFGPEGRRMLTAWDGGRGNWGRTFERLLDSIERSQTDRPASLGSLFSWAKECGYRFPDRVKQALPPVKRDRPHPIQALPRSTEQAQDGEITRERWEWLQWVKVTYNRAAYRFARDNGHLPENPKLKPGQSLAITPPGFWAENNAFVTRGLKRSVVNCDPETIPTVAHWEAMGRPRLHFTSDPAKCLERMAELGHRTILADDATGAGKSQIAGDLLQAWAAAAHSPDTQKAVYFATNYKNPSTLTLEGIPETPTGGAMDFDRDHKTEGGNWHRKRSQSPRPDISALCPEDANIQSLRAKGVDVYRGKDSAMCGNCPHFKGCAFLREQHKAQDSTVLRSHLDKGGKGAIAVVDESGVTIGALRKIECQADDITTERGLIAYRDKTTAAAAADVLNVIQQAMGRAIEERGIHGLSHAELLAMLPQAGELEMMLFDPHFKGWLSPLPGPCCWLPGARVGAHFDEWLGCDDPWGYPLLSALAGKLRKAVQPDLGELFEGRDGTESKAEAIRDQVSPGILPRLIRILTGGAGDVSIAGNGAITFTYRNRRNQWTLAKFKTRILLDSTPDITDLARKLGCKAEEICKVRWTAPRFDNLTIKVVKGIGKAGQQRRDESEYTEQQRIQSLVIELGERAGSAPIGLLDLKRYTSAYQSLGLDAIGHQFAHSRGSNEFKSCEQLIIIAGNAKANLGQLLSEWHCLTGEAATVKTASPAFWVWADHKARANLLQANGRTRAQHRPTTAITHWLVGDISQKDRAALEQLYPGCMVEEVQAFDITPLAASQGYRSDRAIVEAIWQLTTEGEAATIDRVGEIAGLAKSTISGRVKAFDVGGFKALRKSSDLLYKALNNNPELFETAPELSPELLELAKEYLPMLADELEQGRPAAEVARDYVAIFESVGAAVFRLICEATPAGTMARLYESGGFREALDRYDTGPALLGAIAVLEVA